MMPFSTLTKRGRSLNSHIKQSSFDVSELAAAGRLNNSSTSVMSYSSGKLSPLTPFKKLTQFFKRQTSEPTITRSNQSISSTSSENPIFGRSLSDICSPDLPKPISDLLAFLQEVGPFTREIFRKPPNARKCRLLGEKLNSTNFYWDVEESCNGLLLGAVLKTFLREIPNKLCDDRMYNQWSAIINEHSKDNQERRIECIKRLIYRLPQGNQLLLKHLIAALYRIQLRSDENLMTSYNISVCLGPCLLWTKSTNCRELEKASKTVPRLIEFIINNCVEILGRSILNLLNIGDSGLLRNASMSLDSVFADKPGFTFVDSSCQSIDTLTDRLSRRLQSPSRLSYDSGMILDDGSHDEESSGDTKTSTPIHQRFNVSYDSMDCEECVSDEDMTNHNSKHNNNNSLYLNTKELSSLVDSGAPNHNRNLGNLSNVHDSRSSTLCSGNKSNTVSIPKREGRPTILSAGRKPSVSYDKIVYRYISDATPQPYSSNDTFYSLPRPARKSRSSNIVHHDSEHKMVATISQVGAPLAPITCGQSKWRTSEVPMIVIDNIQQHPLGYSNTTGCSYPTDYTDSPCTLRVPSANYLQRPKSLEVSPVYQNVCNTRRLDIPIYENSELYGPSLTLKTRQTRKLPNQSPLYENLTFHRQPPAIRIQRRVMNTGAHSTPPQQATTSSDQHGRRAASSSLSSTSNFNRPTSTAADVNRVPPTAALTINRSTPTAINHNRALSTSVNRAPSTVADINRVSSTDAGITRTSLAIGSTNQTPSTYFNNKRSSVMPINSNISPSAMANLKRAPSQSVTQSRTPQHSTIIQPPAESATLGRLSYQHVKSQHSAHLQSRSFNEPRQLLHETCYFV